MKYLTEQERIVGYKARQQRYYTKNREKLLAKSKLDKLENPERFKEYRRRFHEKNYIPHPLPASYTYCRYCKEKFRIPKSRIIDNGNFCSRKCHTNYQILNAPTDEEKRARWNKYQNEYNKTPRAKKRISEYLKKKRRESPEFVARQKNKCVRALLHAFKRRLRVLNKPEKKSFVCRKCGKEFIDTVERIYCSKECSANSKRVWKDAREAKRMNKRNGNGGIKKKAFDNMRAECDYKCAICGRREPFLDQYWHYLVQDHITPRSKGGKRRSKENIQPLCWDCNNKKGDNIC